MFESVQHDDDAARARAAALPPLLACAVAFLYMTLYALLQRVPALLFWSIDAILFIGAVWGAVGIVRALRRRVPIRFVSPAIGAEIVCAWLFLSFTFPWL